jgi:hypothetical protein
MALTSTLTWYSIVELAFNAFNRALQVIQSQICKFRGRHMIRRTYQGISYKEFRWFGAGLEVHLKVLVTQKLVVV